MASVLLLAINFFKFSINDVIVARKHGLALVHARTRPGWLWRMFQAQAALLVVLMLARVVFRDKTGS